VRVEYPDGFGLCRASNTTPVLVLRFEAENDAALARIQRAIGDAITRIKPDAQLPF
jgi:phosphomannomutase/phosphoglucomutase